MSFQMNAAVLSVVPTAKLTSWWCWIDRDGRTWG